jgi:N-acetylmuramoyl-L-alanine amidase
MIAAARYPSAAALADALVARAPRGHVRAAEALAAVAVNRLAWLARRLGPLLGPGPARCDRLLPAPPEGMAPARDDPAGARWRAVCRRIARRALAGALADPTGGAVVAERAGAPRPDGFEQIALHGFYAFYRPAPPASPPQDQPQPKGEPCPSPSPPPSPPSASRS